MRKEIIGKKVLIVGMGRSGIAATQALLKLGAKVSVQDSKHAEDFDQQFIRFLNNLDVKCYFGTTPGPEDQFDMLVLSPGVPPNLDFINEAKAKGSEIVGELEIAYRIGNGKYIAITGTNGKTTTTTLVGEIFKNACRRTYVVGNIGVAVIGSALIAERDAWMITEVSSFQLETTTFFKPFVSAILNLTQDHMDRHRDMENYGKAKARIFKNQDENDYVVVNYDDKACFALAAGAKARVVPFSRLEELEFGCYVKDGAICINDGVNQPVTICQTSQLIIPGAHNVENALAAAAISYFAGVDSAVIGETLRSFQGVEHRLEFVEEIDGIRFVNDSKGTNPDSSIKAIEAIKGNIILIAGGYDKGSDFDNLIKSFDGKVKAMVLLGKTAPKIKETAERLGFTDIRMAKDMDESVKIAYSLAASGDTVLLSPACASWDMYTCFEQRGEHFKNLVHKLAN